MLRSRSCDFSDEYIFVSGPTKIPEARADDAGTKIDGGDIEVIFKIFVQVIECRNEINNTPKDYEKNLNVVMLIDNLIQ